MSHNRPQVMVSHNMALWEPMHANTRLVTDVLRNRFGLRNGYIGSDNGNVEQLATAYQITDSDGAVSVAMSAGVDQEMPPSGSFCSKSARLAATGALSNLTLDRAVGNILRCAHPGTPNQHTSRGMLHEPDLCVPGERRKKFASGLFERPQSPTDWVAKYVDSAPHRALALQAAREGAVLLINRPPPNTTRSLGAASRSPAGATLPIDPGVMPSVAIIGELGGCAPGRNASSCLAKQAMLGGYTPGLGGDDLVRIVSVEEGFRDRGFKTVWVPGNGSVMGVPRRVDSEATAAAVAAADLVVVVVGCTACGCWCAGNPVSRIMILFTAVRVLARAGFARFSHGAVAATACSNNCGCGEAGDRESFVSSQHTATTMLYCTALPPAFCPAVPPRCNLQ